MKKKTITFLDETARFLLQKYPGQLADCTVVFPNRRAGLFLRKYLSQRIKTPDWSPLTPGLEDFLLSFSPSKKADQLTLIFELFKAFRRHRQQVDYGFGSFYGIGEMLLHDLEEIDHHLVRPDQLFKYIKDDRQIAEDFYFLDTRHEAIIRAFWGDFFPDRSKFREQFMETWKLLLPVYKDFKKQLNAKRIGYIGMIYRELVEQISEQPLTNGGRPLIFAGFNALTPAEEFIIKHFVQACRADMLWDVDAYYMNNEQMEAGRFLRKYRKDPVLAATFPKDLPKGISTPRKIPVTGVSLEVGQAKLIGEEISRLLACGKAQQEDIVIVLPRDYMLFPILNSIPPEAARLNVTMGYPLKETPLFGLLESCIELQENVSVIFQTRVTFHHKQVIEILGHPYLHNRTNGIHAALITNIKRSNSIHILQEDVLQADSPLIRVIFRKVKGDENPAAYLLSIISALTQHAAERTELEWEFMYHFQQLLSRLHDLLNEQTLEVTFNTFKNLFRKISGNHRIPFSGEPAEGLQVMGVLETRNLDFKYVFVPNMNENIFPAPRQTGSFIPYRIRKAFDLPTFEYRDAIYAYLFYRLFQRSQNLSFYHNLYADFGLSGEVSRFIRQLEWESPHTIQYRKLNNPIKIQGPGPITIAKTGDIIYRLKMYTREGNRKLSPSALNVYLDCRLQFYFKYVLHLSQPDKPDHELTPRDFGNVLHRALELLYRDVLKGRSHKIIGQNDLFKLKNTVKGAIKKALHDQFKIKQGWKFEIKGRNLILAAVIEKYIQKILEMDEKYMPFEIKSLESDKEGDYGRLLPVKADDTTFHVNLKGIIDRVDQKNGMIRVIDYKSGKDGTEVKTIASVLDRNDEKRNKAGFQTLYYAWLYACKKGKDRPIVPGLFNIRELFADDFDFRLKLKGHPLVDARPYLPEFEHQFTQVLKDLYGMQQAFDQTDDRTKCRWCDFKGICRR